jgi:hypothetical protein
MFHVFSSDLEFNTALKVEYDRTERSAIEDSGISLNEGTDTEETEDTIMEPNLDRGEHFQSIPPSHSTQ